MPTVPKVTKSQNLGTKEVRHKFNFLHEDKNQSFLKADTIVFGCHDQTCSKYPKQQVFVIFLKYLKKKGGMKFISCMQINKSLYKLILSILVSMASLA